MKIPELIEVLDKLYYGDTFNIDMNIDVDMIAELQIPENIPKHYRNFPGITKLDGGILFNDNNKSVFLRIKQ